MAIQLLLPGLVLPAPDMADLPPALPDLWGWPDVGAATLSAQACLLGAAGEALVDSLLLRYGLVPLPVPPGLAADRLVVHRGRLLRMQIKSTSSARDDGYAVNCERGYRNSPQGRRAYDVEDYDLLAVAVLPENVVWFTTDTRLRHRVSWGEVAALRARPRDSLEAALVALGLDPASPGREGRHVGRDGARDAAADDRSDGRDLPVVDDASGALDVDAADPLPPCAA